MPMTNSKNYGTPNFKAPMKSFGSKKLDEEAEAAREKAEEFGLDSLSWREKWLIRRELRTSNVRAGLIGSQCDKNGLCNGGS